MRPVFRNVLKLLQERKERERKRESEKLVSKGRLWVDFGQRAHE